ncbi:growth/differentiatio [Eucyclogobius newberryi]|uniref:growth/differentiatio n=1 Tax=Eucyclogobius newberryi TaxID=166745 RepID=UPI003B5A5CE3
MEKRLCASVPHYFGVVFFLLLITCTSPVVRPHAAPNAVIYNLSDFTQHPYGDIFSPLIKALSQHGGSRWTSNQRRRIKPEHKYIKYLTEVYKRSSRVQRNVEGDGVYDTVRLIKPQEDCLPHKYEGFMQDLSYRLDQVRKTEHLLKSTLLYSFHPGHSSLVGSVCHLHIKELEPFTHCLLCTTRSAFHTVNFTRGSGVNWVEINVTAFLLPLLKLQKNSLHLLVSVTCEEGTNGESQNHMLESALRSPPLLLYLSDTSKLVHNGFGTNKAEQKTFAMENKLQKEIFKSKQRILHRRCRRSSSKNKRDKSLKTQLPELLPSSEFPTSDCALYDFRVRFSQLKLDHWIVVPPKYNPRYCRGICPRTVGFFYGSPVHTMVQNIIYEKLDSSVPRPSCVPSHYSPLSVMIFEEDGSYVYKEFEDMVATRCTCR